MLFQSRIDRAQKWLHDRANRNSAKSGSKAEGDLPSPEELRLEAQEEMNLEKGDITAMLIAAMITILPVCILVLLVIVFFAGIGYFL